MTRAIDSDLALLLNRRELLERCGMGLGLIGLAGVLADDNGIGLGSPARAASPTARPLGPLAPKPPHFTPRARQVVHLFMNGGPSHVDTFDPEADAGEVPLASRFPGRPSPMQNQCGLAVAVCVQEIRPERHRGERAIRRARPARADDLCVIRSMYADVPNHEPSLMLMNCGDGRLQCPSMGSWITTAWLGLAAGRQCARGHRRLPELAVCVLARRLSGNLYRHAAHPDRQAHREQTNSATPADQRRQLDLVRNDERHAAYCARSCARGADSVVRAGLPHAGRGGGSL